MIAALFPSQEARLTLGDAYRPAPHTPRRRLLQLLRILDAPSPWLPPRDPFYEPPSGAEEDEAWNGCSEVQQAPGVVGDRSEPSSRDAESASPAERGSGDEGAWECWWQCVNEIDSSLTAAGPLPSRSVASTT